MAISKILHMKQAKSGYMAKHLSNALKYVMDPEKTQDGRYVGSVNCDPDTALQQMIDTKRHHGKLDKRQGYHIIISFEEEDVPYDTALEIVARFAKEYLKGEYEAVYSVHDDTAHPHMHLVFNSVRCTNGYKYNYKKGDWERYIQPLVNRLCEEFQLGTLDLDKVREKRHKKASGLEVEPERMKQMSERDLKIIADVDQAIDQAGSYAEFQELLQHMGYHLRGKKHLAVCESGAKRHRRLDHLGEAYTEEMIRYRIEHPPIISENGYSKEAKLTYVFVPYRNRHLTRHQKECFTRKYRAGKIHTNPKVWKYKANLQKLQQLQDEYLFLVEHGIRREEQLEVQQHILDQQLHDIGRQRQELAAKESQYQMIFDTLAELQEAKLEADLYKKEGYPEFEAEYLHYQQLYDRFQALGMTIRQAEEMKQYFTKENETILEYHKEILKKRRIIKRLRVHVFGKKQKTPEKNREQRYSRTK